MKCSSFASTLISNKVQILRRSVATLQINIGRRCNQACSHCHVEAGPNRTENMTKDTIDRILEVIKASPALTTVDITGGAPELNPHFKYLVTSLSALNLKIIDRCNLTILFEPGQEETAHFLKEYRVHIVASLPCYSKERVEKQRGRGVFDKSVLGIQLLNRLGYGRPNSNLILDLVYNPVGPVLPPSQEKLEVDYKRELKDLFDIDFNQLFTITNMPIKRFKNDLVRTGKLESYMETLCDNFNSAAAHAVMCRDLVSVSWNGELFDCDFNQMLALPLPRGKTTVWDIQSFQKFADSAIRFDDHCYACTAGSGSSCGGALTK
ncbi:MAG: arsenosugar biosynthesis radical SAM (seleno)protein ArsS [Bdellovibrionales bacterium]